MVFVVLLFVGMMPTVNQKAANPMKTSKEEENVMHKKDNIDFAGMLFRHMLSPDIA